MEANGVPPITPILHCKAKIATQLDDLANQIVFSDKRAGEVA
jgi:hypothetical protein